MTCHNSLEVIYIQKVSV